MSLIFLKLGGSLITHKDHPMSANTDVIERIAGEIQDVRIKNPDMRIVIGHGSGSFGHYIATKNRTLDKPLKTREQWEGFSEVGYAAGALSHIVLTELINKGLPVVRFPPSAITKCADGDIVQMTTAPIRAALDAGLIPLVHGDIAFDVLIGGTIVSTEDVFFYLAQELFPDKLLLAGKYPGVLDNEGRLIQHITQKKYKQIQPQIGASETFDVTGGMSSKVISMLRLCQELPELIVRIFSGEKPGSITESLASDKEIEGTRISH